MTDKIFLVFWCSQDLEFVMNISDQMQKDMVAKLRGENPKGITKLIHYADIRSRLNPGRDYHLYAIKSDATEESIRLLFKTSILSAADLIKKHGVRFF